MVLIDIESSLKEDSKMLSNFSLFKVVFFQLRLTDLIFCIPLIKV